MRGRRAVCAAAIGLVLATGSPGLAQAPVDDVEEIVVTARRTGIPVWRVKGPKTNMVLIGSINGVAKGTKWDPRALTETLLKADRVMFPTVLGISGSPLKLFGYLLRWRNHATLPKGQTLADHMSPEQFGRLVQLKNRGVLKAGFERRHPLHLAMSLRNFVEKQSGSGVDPTNFVRRTVKKHKISTVPITTLKAKTVVNNLFEVPARTFVPCLLDSVALVEAGPAAMKARSDAWADRRVPDVLASPADKVTASCSPITWGVVPGLNFSGTINRTLQDPQVTVAVVGLRGLAVPGGVLDDLQAAGYQIQGPRWR